MGFPGNVNRYVLSGGLPGGERWSVGFYGMPTLEGTAQDLADGWNTSGGFKRGAVDGIMGQNPAGVTLTRVQVYIYGSGRNIIDQGDATYTFTGTSPLTYQHPNQISAVMTLRSSVRSRRGRGRMYIPALRVPVGANGLADAGAINNLVQPIGQLLDSLSAQVVSEAATAAYPVERVDADLILDQQTSRRDRLVSARQSYSFV